MDVIGRSSMSIRLSFIRNKGRLTFTLFYLEVGGRGVTGVDQRNCSNPHKEWNPDLQIYAPMLYH